MTTHTTPSLINGKDIIEEALANAARRKAMRMRASRVAPDNPGAGRIFEEHRQDVRSPESGWTMDDPEAVAPGSAHFSSENSPLPPPSLFDLERRIRLIENYLATLEDTASAKGKTAAIPYLAAAAFGVLAAVLAGWLHWPP
jgi:hypothetical protein